MARAVRFDLIADASRFTRGMREAERSTGKFEKSSRRLARMTVGLLGGGVAIAGIKQFVGEARTANRVAAQTDAVIKSTGGAAGLSAKGFADLARKLQDYAAVDDDVIQGGQNILATFQKIKAGGPDQVFERASKAAVDMAAALGQGEVTAGGLQAANIKLGRALNDPIKGLQSLTRIGVTFSKQQKEQIEGFVRSGDLASAQGIILEQVAKKFGGSAAASATQSKRLEVAWGNAQEILGNLLIPMLDKGAKALIAVIGVVDRNRGAFGALGIAVVAVTGFVLAMSAATKVALAVQAAIRGATIAWTAAQWLLNVALTANPIGLVIAAIALLVAGIVIAYKRSETFRTVVGKVFDFVRDKVATVVSFIIDAIRGWLNIQIGIVQGILHVMGKLPGPMGAPFRKAEEAVVKAKATINTQIDKIQAKINGLRGKDIPISASLKLNFSSSFTQKDWVSVRAQAGRMAKGGRITRGTGPTADDVLLWGSKGEAMVPARSASKPEFRRWAASERIPGFATGGPIGEIDTESRAINKVQGRGTAGLMDKGLTKLLTLFGSGKPAVLAFIRSTDPLPYIWGAAGPGGYDCSGLASAVLGKHTGAGGGSGQRYFTTASIRSGILGLKPGLGGVLEIGVTAGSGHMAGRYGGPRGLGFEAESSATGIKIGAAASRPESFARHFHLAKGGRIDQEMLARFAALGLDIGGDQGRLRVNGKVFDRGGWLMPGATLAVNRTGRPEPVGMPMLHLEVNFNGPVLGDTRAVAEQLTPAIRTALKTAARREGKTALANML